ncbi:MAG: restriction endonuclease subunit S [Treponema sp.]|uniref:restriction endonuclease subunit S n=1 Tax=Treponema sp. TaxID=166 RepID=UPI002A90BE31|nr:restriction endonuclease subunit S [Treponema sp.]MDY6397877.1 restriction endonuclease subunit S [Treponema sp.]
MSEWKKVKIGDIFSIEKGSLQSSKCTPGEYDFITAATDWKTHNSFDHECEAIVYAVAASGSLGRAHYVNGKFIASDLCFILTEKDKNQYPINFLFYQIVFEMLRDEIVSKTKTGTSKESINRGNFSNYEIPYFPIEFQLANYQKFVNAKNIIKNLLEESEKQKNYIKQLRQNILQQAIEGKLTADWRKQNPVQKGNPDYDAEALFEQIQKERNIEKKQKELSPITDEEKPFEIPEGWKWVRLGEISYNRSTGPFGSMLHKSDYVENGIPLINPTNIKTNHIDYSSCMRISPQKYKELSHYALSEKDIILARRGDLSKCGIIQSSGMQICGTGCFFMKLYMINHFFFKFVYQSQKSQNYLLQDSIGQTMDNLNQKLLEKLPIPLPSLAEQKEIITRVEKHLQTVSDLENQITERELLTKQLMQSILKDAFKES